MRWFGKRSYARQLEEKVEELRTQVRDKDRALSRMGHEKREALRRAEQLLRDLRMVSVQLEGVPPGDRVAATVVIDHHMVWHTFRRDKAFRELLGMMLEREFERSDAGRGLLRRSSPYA